MALCVLRHAIIITTAIAQLSCFKWLASTHTSNQNQSMTLRQNQLRLIAIPVFLCASWFLDCRKLFDSLVVRTKETVAKEHGTVRYNNTTTLLRKPSSHFGEVGHNAAEQALQGQPVGVQHDNKKQMRPWHNTSKAVQALKKEVAESLTPEERKLWYEKPVFHPFPQQIECPSPKKFERPTQIEFKELDFTEEQKNNLRQELEQGSITIRKAFEPWIDTNGFHPDLILHAGRVAGLFVGIFDGKLYFWGRNHSSAKVRLLSEHLESVLEEFHKQDTKVPDVVFPYAVRSSPPDSLTKQCARYSAVPKHLQDRYNAVPVAGIAMDPTIHSGIALMPNMYFGNLQVWDRYTKELLGMVDVPWNKRNKRVFWRGKISKRLDANIPRMEALQAAARDFRVSPRRMDIMLTSGCDYLKQYAKNVTRTSPLAPKWLPKDYFLKVTECGGHTKTPHAKFTNYWAQLNLPGSSLGSYSKNLQNLWPTGAAVMIWNQSAVEFYYDSLKTGITHVWVNETTIEPMTEKLFDNYGKLAQLMGRVGREWFEEHLTASAILEYYRQWFHAWAALQRFTPTPDMLPEPCTCSGWIDADDKKHNEVERCPFCSAYPSNVRNGCLKMMGLESDKSICK